MCSAMWNERRKAVGLPMTFWSNNGERSTTTRNVSDAFPPIACLLPILADTFRHRCDKWFFRIHMFERNVLLISICANCQFNTQSILTAKISSDVHTLRILYWAIGSLQNKTQAVISCAKFGTVLNKCRWFYHSRLIQRAMVSCHLLLRWASLICEWIFQWPNYSQRIVPSRCFASELDMVMIPVFIGSFSLYTEIACSKV